VMTALLRLVRSCVEVAGENADRLATLDHAAIELLANAERTLLNPDDLARFRDDVEHLRTRSNRTAL
jgi:ubiquinone biosynthesis protein UbiJ